MGLLLAVLKATTNLMHKLAAIISEMLSSDSIDIHELNWPEQLKGSTSLEISEWTQKQLSDLEVSCENLLIEGICSINSNSVFSYADTAVDSVPHDTSVAAAMLLFVIFNISHNSSLFQSHSVHCDSVLCSKLDRWFSDLKPFAQLTVCHGALAKLPPSLLLSTQMEERPLLVALFPRICKLFDRYKQTLYSHVCSQLVKAFQYLCLFTIDTNIYCTVSQKQVIVTYHHVQLLCGPL